MTEILQLVDTVTITILLLLLGIVSGIVIWVVYQQRHLNMDFDYLNNEFELEETFTGPNKKE